MATPEVNTLGFVHKSTLSSKDPLSVCSACFNLDPELIPPDQNRLRKDLLGADGTKRIDIAGDLMRDSAAKGCPSCTVLLEGVSTYCAVLHNDVDWNPQERLLGVLLYCNLERGLVLRPKFKDEERAIAPDIEFFTRNG
jgi:hypothetical protein